MDASELDPDLGTLLLAMAEEMTRECPGASMMLRALEARYCDLYGRLEGAEAGELMTHARAVSQLEALYRSIRLASGREGARKLRGLPTADGPRPRRGGLPAAARAADGANEGGGESQDVDGDEASQGGLQGHESGRRNESGEGEEA
jgi:hypothetical protein